jgi:hypothetical protein
MGSFPGCPRRADRTQPADLDSSGWPRASMGACRSRTNADDRLPLDPLGLDPLGRVEGSDGIVEGRDVADVRPQSSVPHPLASETGIERGRLFLLNIKNLTFASTASSVALHVSCVAQPPPFPLVNIHRPHGKNRRNDCGLIYCRLNLLAKIGLLWYEINDFSNAKKIYRLANGAKS